MPALGKGHLALWLSISGTPETECHSPGGTEAPCDLPGSPSTQVEGAPAVVAALATSVTQATIDVETSAGAVSSDPGWFVSCVPALVHSSGLCMLRLRLVLAGPVLP